MKYCYLAVAAILLLFLRLGFPPATALGQQPSSMIAQIGVLPASPTTNDNISIKISGEWPNACTPGDPRVSRTDDQIIIATSNPGQSCGQASTPWSHTVSIGKLPKGFYKVRVTHSLPTGSSNLGTRIFSVTSVVGLLFHPLPSPVRLLDTRPGQPSCFNPGVSLGNAAILTQQVRGACTGIPAHAEAIVGNATIVNSPTISSGFNWITLFPSDAPQPNSSNLNFTNNQIVPNWFTVRLGPDGAFNIFSQAATDLIVDITGYYAPPHITLPGMYYHPLPSPVRLFDSRPGQVACDAPGTPLSAGGTRAVLAQGICAGGAIPSTAKAIVGNATVVNSGSTGDNFITLFPFGEQQPGVSNLNFRENQIVPNWFTVGLSHNGKFNIFSTGSTDFIVDVSGYFSEDPLDDNGPGLLFRPLMTPVRLFDTRPGESACQAPGAPLPDNNTISLPAPGVCFTETIPTTARVIEGNATVVNFISTGFNWITFFPCGVQQPLASNLNFTENQIVPNWFAGTLDNLGNICIFSRASTHFIMDISGYFAQ